MKISVMVVLIRSVELENLLNEVLAVVRLSEVAFNIRLVNVLWLPPTPIVDWGN